MNIKVKDEQYLQQALIQKPEEGIPTGLILVHPKKWNAARAVALAAETWALSIGTESEDKMRENLITMVATAKAYKVI